MPLPTTTQESGPWVAQSWLGLALTIVCALAVGVVPLLLGFRTVWLQGEWARYWVDQPLVIDTYSAIKADAIRGLAGLCCALVVAFRLAGAWAQRNSRRALAYTPASREQAVSLALIGGGFFLLTSGIIGSWLFSQTSRIATWGMPDRWEGGWVQLSYLVLALAGLLVGRNQRGVIVLVGSALAGALIVAVFGILQWARMEPFSQPLILPLLRLYQGASMSAGMSVNPSPRLAASTLYNTNYVGSYLALLLPFAGWAILRSKNWLQRIGTGFLFAFLLEFLVLANSRAGQVAVVASAILWGGPRWWRSASRRDLEAAATAVLGYTALCAALAATGLVPLGEVGDGLFRRFEASKHELSEPHTERIVNLERDGLDAFRLYLPKGVLRISWVDKELPTFLALPDQVPVAFSWSGPAAHSSAPPFEDIDVVIADAITLKLTVKGAEIYVRRESAGFVAVSWRLRGVDLALAKAPVWWAAFPDGAFTGRAYIWKRTLPTLKNTVFLGVGPDAFATLFPNDDLVGQANLFGHLSLVFDKPHNLYLQIASQTGWLSLLGFLLLAGVALWPLPSRNSPELCSAAPGAVVFRAALGGYLIAGLFNDSIVCVAPVFWVVLGVHLGRVTGRWPVAI